MANNVDKKIAAIIPARMAASRFPGKPLAKIAGLEMIEHVRRRAALCGMLDQVYVATCDKEIMQAVEGHGGKAIMTAKTHERCTDRIEEAARSIEADIVVIVQGDEPLFDPQVIELLVKPMLHDESIQVTNLLSVIKQEVDIKDVDVVKAVLDNTNNLMYYSRAAIPYRRVKTDCPAYRQTGLSAFTKDFLVKFSKLEPTFKEIAESVDFLRILEHGYKIKAVIYSGRTIGVDREEDIKEVEKILSEDKIQKEIYKKIIL